MSTASPTALFDAAIMRAVGWAMVGALVIGAFVAGLSATLYPLWWWVLVAPPTAAAFGVVVARCIAGSLGRRGRLSLVLLTAAASGLTVVALAPAEVGAWTAVTPVTGFALLVVGLFDGPRPSVLAAVSVLVAADVLLPLTLQGDDLSGLPVRVGLEVANFAAGCVGGFAARRMLATAERDRGRLAAALQRDQIVTAWIADRREQERLLHDTVLSTLTAIGGGALTDSEGVRARCRTDADHLGGLLRRVERRSDDEDVVEQLVALADSFTGLGFAVSVAVDASPPPALPPFAASALVGAAREALGNAHRHSGANGAELSLRGGVPVELTVRDRGHGPGRRPGGVGGGLGLRRSVEERMRDAGGHAEIVEAVGGGTAVVLRWPR